MNYTCPYCGFECESQAGMERHLKSHGDLWKCNICAMHIRKSEAPKHHKEYHPSYKLSCPYCPEIHLHSQGLAEHVKRAHMIQHASRESLKERPGARGNKLLPDGREATLYATMFGGRILIGPPGDLGGDEEFMFEGTFDAAHAAWANWDGYGQPEGWVRWKCGSKTYRPDSEGKPVLQTGEVADPDDGHVKPGLSIETEPIKDQDGNVVGVRLKGDRPGSQPDSPVQAVLYPHQEEGIRQLLMGARGRRDRPVSREGKIYF